jgi:hypothetical protein
MRRAGSAYMSGIAAAAGLRPHGTKVLRPPLRLYGAQRVLVGEQTSVGPSARRAIASAPAMPAPARAKPPVTSPRATTPGPTNSPLGISPPATADVPAAPVVTTRVVTETAPAPAQPSSVEKATRPPLVPADAREKAPVSPPVLERQPPPEPEPRETVALIRGARPVDRSRAPAAEPAAAVQADLLPPIEQQAPIQAAREPRALTLEPNTTIPVGPPGTPHTVSQTPVRPSTRQQQTPTVQIGVIDVTVLPSPAAPISIVPQAPSPVPAAAGTPLSRGVGSWYGLAQR